MASGAADEELVGQAVAGDVAALERLLVSHYDRLAADMARKLPDEFRGLIAADDVLQEAFVVAFREIRNFTPRGPDSFYKWLATIAKHRLFDLVKAQRTAKRGGGRVALAANAKSPDDSLVGLLEQLRVTERTPSRSAAGREAIGAVQVGLAGLKDDYREALRLRYIEGLPVAEVAARMGRTKRAVHMLCHRGLRRLREAVGRSSQFFSSK
ncbi:MAG: sigma-70 family RNA polymerase sigma factor [Phycisphaerae bacterium]|nr:sigma-70 family RNA polymerase sigma factor [Phycisphaerae bacterium]